MLIFLIRENETFISVIYDPLFFAFCEPCQEPPPPTL